jgi:CRISPR system Cascade subunit CasD
MKEYLVFRLYGPMASWGVPAVGGDRATAIAPTRSALLGLLGAAMGITRDNAAKLEELQQSVLFGVKQCVPSSILRDYHSAQVPSKKRGVTHLTRKSELSEAKLNTVLSSRDYRCDGVWIVAVWLRVNSQVSLLALKEALVKPVYPLYLGRKSCPLALPLSPKILETDTLQQALDADFPHVISEQSDKHWLGANGFVTYFWEGAATEFDDEHTQSYQPWDEPVHRGRWQFKQRTMHQLTVQEAK